MASETHGRSIRNLLLVVVFQLGVCIVVLAGVVEATRGYEALFDTLARLLGGGTAFGALTALYLLEKSSLE